MRRALLAWLVVATALAGCGAKSAPAAAPPVADDRMRVAGLVESDTLVPLANATVAIAELNLTVQTDDLGNFAFPPLAPRVYSVEARLPGYRATALVARPETNPGALDFVLQRAVALLPRQEQFHFRGTLDCGFEALVLAGPCDAGSGLLRNQTAFAFPVAAGWRTAVVDVLFDASANRGLAGLRLLVSGHDANAQAGTYQAYGAANHSKPYTVRLEPGLAIPGGQAPVSANLTSTLLQVQPQGQLDCLPATPAPGAQCTHGVGAGVNIQFDLYVTVFYVDPAPAGFTLRTDA